MRKKAASILVNPLADEFGSGIRIEKALVKDFNSFEQADLRILAQAEQSHRDDYHLFFLLEEGTISIEIDFQRHTINPSSVICIHPSQVHRILSFENVSVTFWTITNENLNPENLLLLENITPAMPLTLDKDTFSILSDAASLSIKIAERHREKLHRSLLKDSCNTLVSLVASQYLAQFKPAERLSRFEIVTKAFKLALERDFRIAKKPGMYAQKLHLSIPYLNECVKNTTGYSVSHHIQQRVILEAKRFLHHSDKSVKEIAFELGYDDYPQFSRLFTKIAGMTALTFRNQNLDLFNTYL